MNKIYVTLTVHFRNEIDNKNFRRTNKILYFDFQAL